MALNRVDIDMYPGEIHALLGENGAGKSILIKILAGIFPPSEGDIWFEGVLTHPTTRRLPISFIHQELGLVGSMSVAENIALVAGYPRRGGLISWKGTADRAKKILDVIGSDIGPHVLVNELPAAEKSLVAIARSLAVEQQMLVLDEPTATLPESDVSRLFSVLSRLRDRGLAILYVTHRLDEVFRLADQLTVLRDGKKVSSRATKATDSSALVLDIIGRPISEVFISPPRPSSEVVLRVDNLCLNGVGPVDFQLASGEILGLVGLRGAGHHQVGRALFGDLAIISGSITLLSKPFVASDPNDAITGGFGFLSSKRIEESLASGLTVRENLFLNPRLMGAGFMDLLSPGVEKVRSGALIDRFDIRPRNSELTVSALSGGNQQKVALARAMELGTKVLLLEEPTAGVDVGSKADIYAMMGSASKEGRCVLMISSDFEEVAYVCHRALVFNRGRVTAELARSEVTVDRLTTLASGGAWR